jgi:tetratricopeptide (TPR) repeat protein
LSEAAGVLDGDPAVIMALGAVALARNQFDEAKSHYEKVLVLNPRHEEALAGLVHVAFHTGDYQNGLKYVDQLLAINPWLPDMLGAQAQMLKVMGQPARGIASAERALNLNPRRTAIRAWLIETYQAAGDIKNSQRHQDILDRMSDAVNIEGASQADQ